MGRVEVRSAGSSPANDVTPVVARVLARWGIDITRAQPKILEPNVVESSNVVVTMGCGDACPIYPGVRYEDWALDDPAGQPEHLVELIRDEIDRRVRNLLSELIG